MAPNTPPPCGSSSAAPNVVRPIVAVDLDEVLGGFVPQLASFHNVTYGTDLSATSFNSYEFHQVWGGTREEADAKMLAFFASEHFTGSTSGGSSGNSTVAVGIPIIAGAKEVLKKYADRFDFHVVTSRQNLLEAETLRWLKHWYPGVFRGVEFGNHYAQEGIHRSKPDMCKEIGACLLIDDSMRYATQCASAGIPVVLFGDYAWNAGKAPAGVQRASDWAQVDRILSDLASSRSSSSGASASSCTMDLSRPGT